MIIDLTDRYLKNNTYLSLLKEQMKHAKLPKSLFNTYFFIGERGGTINVVHRRSRSDGTGLAEGDGKLPPTPVKRGVPSGGRKRRTRIPDKPDMNFRFIQLL